MKGTSIPKLTFKTAKALAIAEVGTAAGLTPHESNNSDYQLYEMRLGNYTLFVSNNHDYLGVAYVSFAGKRTYYNLDSLEVSYVITDNERKKERNEVLQDAVANQSEFLFKALLEKYGSETCHAMLKAATKTRM